MKHMKKKLLAASFAALAALGAGSANAAIVTQWTVGVDASFVPGSIVDSNGGMPGGVAISNSDRSLRWGTSTGLGRSGLDITNSPSSANVTTGINAVLPAVANISVTHINQPVTGTSLDRVSLASTLTLTPFVPAMPGLPSQTLTFLIDFLETPNGNAGDACAGGGTSGAAGVNVNGCADIFVIDQGALNFSFFYDTDGDNFGDPAQQYFISFLELTNGLNPLNPTACQSVLGAGNTTCLGFLTPERANTTVQFGSIITTERVSINVPEPQMLGLLGLGFIALGFSRRRKV